MENYVPSSGGGGEYRPLSMRPLEPMLARPLRTFSDIDKHLFATAEFSENFIIQEKFDGERMLCAVSSNGGNKCYSRTLKPLKFPYKIALKVPNAILDGELIYTRKMPNDRDELNDLERLAICNTGDKSALIALYVIFDVQAINNNWIVNSHTTGERIKLLFEIIDREKSARNVIVAPILNSSSNNNVSNSGQLIDFLLAHTRQFESEGLMVKRTNGSYKAARRDADWFKLKVAHLRELRGIFELQVERVLLDRNGLPSILICGYESSSGFHEVVRISSGITCETRRRLTLLFRQDDGYPCDDDRPIKIKFTADVSSKTSNNSYRHPVFLDFVT